MSNPTKNTPRIWGSVKQGYWVYTGKYGEKRISPVFATQAEARHWRMTSSEANPMPLITDAERATDPDGA